MSELIPVESSLAELLLPTTEAGGRLGGKGRALAELVTARFPVPMTGVVTVAAYRAVAGDHSIGTLTNRIAADEMVAAEEVDRIFNAAPVPDAVRAAIVGLSTQVGDGGPIAVRSSATVEDLHGSSFAGQYRTVLDVPGGDEDAVLAAVRQVWASLWHPAPAAYRRAFGIDESDVAMAVVLMRMIPATSAGVVFTADPGGSDGARVESVEGLGESLVSGATTPSAWVVPTAAIAQPEAIGRPQLPAAAAKALTLAVDVEHAFGAPQDVEWAAIDDDVYLVQARPITALADDDGFDTAVDDHELTTAGIVEMVPGVLPPLRWELNRFLLEEAFRSVLDSLGIIRGSRAEDRPFVRRVRGRAAIDFDQLRQVAAGIPGAVQELEVQYFGRAPVDEPSEEPAPLTRLTSLSRELRTIQTQHRVTDQSDMMTTATTSLRHRRPALAGLSNERLLAYLRRLVDLAARGLAAELGVAAAGAASYRRLEILLSRYLGENEGPGAAMTVTAGSGIAVKRTTDASAAVFGGPTWNELGSSPPDPPSRTDEGAEQRREQLETRLKALPGWTRRRILTGQFIDTRIHLVRRTTTDVIEQLRRREATKAAVLELGGEVRRVYLELGRRLVDQEALTEPADIELLTSGEAAVVLAGGDPPTIDTLRRRMNWISRYEAEGGLPLRFRGIPDREPEPLPDGDVLTGWAASPGRRRGRARVVSKPTDRFGRGEILVAETTDASWSPLFVKAGAIVVERGGPLSHAAILARELGLPAVLNLPGATGVLDGCTISVDGDQGVVVIEERVADDA